jgi:hypothetical protein
MKDAVIIRMIDETSKGLARMRFPESWSCAHIVPSYIALVRAAKANHPNDPFLAALPVLDRDQGKGLNPTELQLLFTQLRIALESLHGEPEAEGAEWEVPGPSEDEPPLGRRGPSSSLFGEVDLTGVNLSGVKLDGADLRGANLREADLRNADLTDAILVDANLSDADLRGANLRGTNLTGANLSGADLRDTDLSGLDLSGVNLSEMDMRNVDLRSLLRSLRREIPLAKAPEPPAAEPGAHEAGGGENLPIARLTLPQRPEEPQPPEWTGEDEEAR